MDKAGLERTVYKTHFTYFDQKGFMADIMVQSAYDGVSELLSSHLWNSLQMQFSAGAVREYDLFLTEALRDAQLPEGWSLVGLVGRGGKRLSTVDGECHVQSRGLVWYGMVWYGMVWYRVW